MAKNEKTEEVAKATRERSLNVGAHFEDEKQFFVLFSAEDLKLLKINFSIPVPDAKAIIRGKLALPEKVRAETSGVGAEIREAMKGMTAEDKKKVLDAIAKIKK